MHFFFIKLQIEYYQDKLMRHLKSAWQAAGTVGQEQEAVYLIFMQVWVYLFYLLKRKSGYKI